MGIKLRGHHLICLNFFKGEGYSPEFVDNIYNLKKDNNITVTPGADDVCLKCPYLKNEKCANPEFGDDEIKKQDADALNLLNLKPGDFTNWDYLTNQLPEILPAWREKYCGNCIYKNVCF